ncbi:hypothetical protein [uncultured Rhodoblastus sp.]|uniref:hypothetical protein n=1 Tax=uncultured Rhodoblastus sp. TaxID=543037 RepID=UPI0025E29606|nr:hypothetical protein [uncultured Rhodoblastus sp.]
MRYLLAAAFVCALGMPAASAFPAFAPHAPSGAEASPIVQVAKRGKPVSRRHRSRTGGIHALVGSGDY